MLSLWTIQRTSYLIKTKVITKSLTVKRKAICFINKFSTQIQAVIHRFISPIFGYIAPINLPFVADFIFSPHLVWQTYQQVTLILDALAHFFRLLKMPFLETWSEKIVFLCPQLEGN